MEHEGDHDEESEPHKLQDQTCDDDSVPYLGQLRNRARSSYEPSSYARSISKEVRQVTLVKTHLPAHCMKMQTKSSRDECLGDVPPLDDNMRVSVREPNDPAEKDVNRGRE